MHKKQKYIESIREIITTLMTFLIDSDKINDTRFFDIFCNYNIISTLQNLHNIGIYLINYALIQGFSFLLVNLTNTITAYYFYSNNLLNDLITIDIHKYDDEYLSYYISLLKSIALRIDLNTIQLFYNEHTNSFPIVENAIKLYNYSNPMISTVVHNIILSILTVKYEPIKLYFSKLPTVEYFIFIACRLRDLSLIYIQDTSKHDIYEDIIDEIMYVNDILCIGLDTINFILTNALFYYFIMPVVIKGIIQSNDDKEGEVIILLALFARIKEESFVNVLYQICFGDYISESILEFCDMDNNIQINKHYYFTWNEQQNKPNETYIEFIMLNYSDIFFKALPHIDCWVYNKENQYQEIFQLKQIVLNLNSKSEAKSQIDHHKIEFLIMKSFTPDDTNKMNAYHQSISSAIGIKSGVYYNPDYECNSEENIVNNCVLVNVHKLIMVNENNINKSNPIKQCIMDMFSDNSPDNNTYQILIHFMFWIILTQVPISNVLLEINGLFRTNNNNTTQLVNNNKNKLLCFNNKYFQNNKQQITNNITHQEQLVKNQTLVTTLIESLITETIELCSSKCYEVIEYTCLDLIYICTNNNNTIIQDNIPLINLFYSKVNDSFTKQLKQNMTTTFPKETFLTLNTKVTTHLNKIINNKTCYEIIIKRIYTLTLLQDKFQSKSKTDRSFIKQIHFEKTLLIFHTALYLINQTNSSISNESFLNSIINIYDNNI